MSFITIKERRMPESCISAFRMTNQGVTINGYLEVRIYGKIEFVYFESPESMRETYDYLTDRLSGFVKIGEWNLRKKDVREYKRVSRSSESLYYIEVKVPYMSSIKLRFASEERLNEAVMEMDERFNVK